ncbi:hypothetical protein L596_011756 [Steinernema carpocapsae]|uniref:PITH domain-containing protein n=1 Tax=Steinernema carpocapsae TaxID=34508 RepID=A0A4V6A4K8_STECR|nr:hypothetical protein L596_011756 [Steinernema carpocapsae]
MSGHGHSCQGGCSHEAAPAEDASMVDLFSVIKVDNVEVYNETTNGSGRKVFKKVEDCLNMENFVESDYGPELTFDIPFSAMVEVHSIKLVGDLDETHPAVIQVFDQHTNPTDLPLDKALYTKDLMQDDKAEIVYNLPVKARKTAPRIIIHFPSNFSRSEEGITKIYYLGLQGMNKGEIPRQQVVITNYESTAQLKDHKTDTMNQIGRQIF